MSTETGPLYRPEDHPLVRVYRNRTAKQWSVQRKTADGWRVASKQEVLTLKDVTFRVSEASRQRAQRLKQRNVHATVEGTLTGLCDYEHPERLRVRYHYSETDGFVTPDRRTVQSAAVAVFDAAGHLWVIGPRY